MLPRGSLFTFTSGQVHNFYRRVLLLQLGWLQLDNFPNVIEKLMLKQYFVLHMDGYFVFHSLPNNLYSPKRDDVINNSYVGYDNSSVLIDDV